MGEVEKTNDTIKIPSSADYIATVDEFLEDWLRRRGVSEDTIADLAIAITELVNNAIKHGNAKDVSKSVTVHLCIKDGEARATISDQGSGFDPQAVADPIAPENLLKEIGRGIFIVRSLMDELKFQFPPEGGTRVTVVKRIS